MDTREIILYLSHQESFPAKLGAAIGCEKALLWFKLYKRFGEAWFSPIDGFGADVGIKNSKGLILELRFHNLLLEKEENKLTQYKANIEKIFELVDHASLDVESPPPFTSPEFLEAVNSYIRMLRSKGRGSDKEKIYEQLKSHPVDICIQALNYSTQKGFVTLYFDGLYGQQAAKSKANATGFHANGRPSRHSAGGSKVSSDEGSGSASSFPTRKVSELPVDFPDI